ncbi:MAG: hypothetical protein ACTSPV_11625 [Candidatus Hodarchaeales archaeon]
MVSKENYKVFRRLFFLPLLFSVVISSSMTLATPVYEKEITKAFHLISPSDPKQTQIADEYMKNEALIDLQCSLTSNSTSPITILIGPESVWNVTSLLVTPGRRINVSITNGKQGISADTRSPFGVTIECNNDTFEIWGYIFIGIITYGWEEALWPFIPSMLAILLVTTKYRRKKTG